MADIDLKVLREFEDAIRKDIPTFQVAFKDESWLMKMFGFLTYPFNDRFMSSFTTTMGWTVYFPNKQGYESDPASKLRTLAHEYVHLWDTKENPWTFKLSYIFPQILCLIPLLVFGVLAWPHSWLLLLPFAGYVLGCTVAHAWKPAFWIVFGLVVAGTGVLTWLLVGWKLFVLLGSLVFLAPWPARWRTKWELRGYSMNVALAWWIFRAWNPAYRDRIVQNFVGPSYYFMSWSSSKVKAALLLAHQQAQDGSLHGLVPYQMVHEFLYTRSLMRR